MVLLLTEPAKSELAQNRPENASALYSDGYAWRRGSGGSKNRAESYAKSVKRARASQDSLRQHQQKMIAFAELRLRELTQLSNHFEIPAPSGPFTVPLALYSDGYAWRHGGGGSKIWAVLNKSLKTRFGAFSGRFWAD